MASTAGGQDEKNPDLWLAAREGKMPLSRPLGITRCDPQEKFKFRFIQVQIITVY